MGVGFLRRTIDLYDKDVWIRLIGAMLTTITGFMIRPFLVLYLYDKLNGSILLPMLVISLAPLCGLFVSWYGGSLSDKYGRKPIMFASLVLQACCLVGYVFADSVWLFAAISIVNGAGNALFMPAANAQMTDLVPPERRSELFALLHTAFNVGAAIGPMLGLVLFRWNQTIVFVIAAVITLLYGILVAVKMKESAPTILRKRELGQAEFAPQSVTKVRIGGLGTLFRKDRTLLFMTLYSLPVGFLYTLAETAMPIHLKTYFDNSQAVFAGMFTFNGISVIALQIWIARRTESMKSYALVGFSYVLFSVVAIGYGFSSVVIALYLSEFVFTVGEMIFGPHIQKVVSMLATEDRRGYYFAVFGASRFLGQAIAPLIGGVLLEWNGGNGEWLFTGMAVLLAAAGLAQYRVMRNEARRKETTVAA